jgi:hypothetical protein
MLHTKSSKHNHPDGYLPVLAGYFSFKKIILSSRFLLNFLKRSHRLSISNIYKNWLVGRLSKIWVIIIGYAEG